MQTHTHTLSLSPTHTFILSFSLPQLSYRGCAELQSRASSRTVRSPGTSTKRYSQTAADRRGNNLKGLKDYYLKAQAIILPSLPLLPGTEVPFSTVTQVDRGSTFVFSDVLLSTSVSLDSALRQSTSKENALGRPALIFCLEGSGKRVQQDSPKSAP